jgi:uncharacterized protein (TIGR00661 family)
MGRDDWISRFPIPPIVRTIEFIKKYFFRTPCSGESDIVKILYGVCGEGLGHASRSRILIHYLKQQHHDIRIIAGGKAYTFLSKEFNEIEKIESPKGFYQGNRVRILYTILHTFYQSMVATPLSFFKVRHIIKEFKPDILITDAEPISHVAARLSKVKRISIDNPQVLLHRKYNVKFGEYRSWFILLVAVKVSMFGAEKYIIYDFSDEQIDDPRVLFLKPLIQPGIRTQTPTTSNHIFVYQTSLSSAYICDLLKKFDETFIIYGFNKEHVDENLIFKRFNEKEFYNDIASAKAIITTAGFTVISEALYLKKPLFCLPIQYQFEQIFNGRCVETMGVGVSHKKFRKEDLTTFLKNLDFYKSNLQKYDPGNQDEILKRIERELHTIVTEKKR